MKRLVDMLLPLMKGRSQSASDPRRQIFSIPFHITFDNHFSGMHILEYLGALGLGGMGTVRRDRIDRSIKMHLHYEKSVPVNAQSRLARFQNPIVATKHVSQPTGSNKHDYTIVHMSGQSTGSMNIASVNSLDACELYVRPKNRGRGSQRLVWAIEMNQARELYLGSYHSIDKIDHAIKLWSVYYRTWRWWHAPKRHGDALAYTMAYLMYEECASGTLDPEWKVDTPMSRKEFRQRLPEQMCNYRAHNTDYPGECATESCQPAPISCFP